MLLYRVGSSAREPLLFLRRTPKLFDLGFNYFMNTAKTNSPKLSRRVLSVLLAFLCTLCVMTPFTVTSQAAEQKFEPRLTAPYNNFHYTTGNVYYNCGYGMPNCTCYAWGRIYEILGTKPNLPNCNAGQWYGRNRSSGAYPYGRSPQVGAVACWSHHVAVVEQIKGNQIVISESHYSGRYFDTKTLTIGNEGSYAGTFQGYIYCLSGRSGKALNDWSFKTGSYITNTNGRNLNLRATPDYNGKIIDKIPHGTKVYVTEVKGEWGKISFGDQTGWICLAWTDPLNAK